MKKTILFFTTVVLISITSALAQGGTTGPLTWEINNGTLTISGEGEMPDYNGDQPWYDYKDDIHTLVIESGVSSIGYDAFSYFDYLTSVEISNTVLSIEMYAFSDCKNLPSIAFPDGLVSIAKWAFQGCSELSSVFLSKSVAEIDPSPFGSCNSLTSIEVDSENTYYASENGILFNKDKTAIICYPAGKEGEYVIPNSVKTIGNAAFRSCTATSITIPNSVTSIGESAFSDCSNLISMTIPTGVTSIKECTFCTCSSLTSITIPNSVTSIGQSAFNKCTSLISITIPTGVISIGWGAFIYCKSLQLITNLNPVPVDIPGNVFNGVDPSACTLEVPMGSVAAYKEAEVWKLFNIVGINVGIVETDNYPSLRVYPNPTTGVLNLIQESINNEQLTINNVEIFDIYGRKLSSHHLITSSSNHLIISSSNHQINIAHFPAGIYFLKITTENGVFVEKVVKN